MKKTFFTQIKDLFVKSLLNDKFILVVIFINAVIIYLQESGYINPVTSFIDVICTIIFIAEMVIKHIKYGVHKYWSNPWDRFDGILVIVSIPSVISIFLPVNLLNLSFLLAFRVLRVFRFFRVVHFFPGFEQIASGFSRALKQSYAIFIGFFLLIIIFALISCSLFKDVAPLFFDTPTDSIYSIFRLFTVEGWYEIPDAIASVVSPFWARMSRLYFCFLLILGGIIGMSLVNSIFVDAMVSDNNDDLKAKIDALEAKIDELLKNKN